MVRPLFFLLVLLPSSLLFPQEGVLSFRPSGAGGPALEIQEKACSLRLGGEAGPLVFLEEEGKKTKQVPLPGSLSWKKAGGGFLLRGLLRGRRPFQAAFLPAGPEQVLLRLEVEKKKPGERTGLALSLEPGEALYGLMERTVPGPQALSWNPGISRGLDLRGLSVEMSVKPTLSLYEPFLVSSRGWSLLVKGTWPGRFDLGASRSNTVEFSFPGPRLEVLFHLPGRVLECVRSQALRAGPPFVPPSWAFGPWRWRDNHANPKAFFDGVPNRLPFNTLVVEDILMMEALGIPCSAYWVDRPWARGFMGYGSLQFDRKRLPQPERMIRWLDRRGIRFLLWLSPWVCDGPLKEARERGYLLPRSMGAGGRIGLVDFTNPAATAWWQERIRPLVDAGTAGFKLDRSEEILKDSRADRAADGRTLTELRNDYPRLYLKAVHDLLERTIPGKGLAMPRAGYTGSQKFGIFWGGDIKGGPWGLRASLVALQRAAFMGFPFWGSDTGGYWGKRDRETLRRWIAFSCFCPVMEVGPTWDLAPWSWPDEPSYDVETLATWRFYAVLRTRLKGYIQDLARKARREGLPLVRALAMLWPERKEAARRFDEYLFGPDILVCPVWRDRVLVREVWLPPGEWVDAWNGKEHRGPALVQVPCPVPRIPLFLKRGSSLGLGDLPGLWDRSLQAVVFRPDMARLQEKALERLEEGGPGRGVGPSRGVR